MYWYNTSLWLHTSSVHDFCYIYLHPVISYQIPWPHSMACHWHSQIDPMMYIDDIQRKSTSFLHVITQWQSHITPTWQRQTEKGRVARSYVGWMLVYIIWDMLQVSLIRYRGEGINWWIAGYGWSFPVICWLGEGKHAIVQNWDWWLDQRLHEQHVLKLSSNYLCSFDHTISMVGVAPHWLGTADKMLGLDRKEMPQHSHIAACPTGIPTHSANTTQFKSSCKRQYTRLY